MRTIEVYCPAKVNLFLNVTGYNDNLKLHDIVAYNQTIDMYDRIKISDRLGERNIIISTSNNIPKDENNSAYKAAKVFLDYTGIPYRSLHIDIIKGIPVGAGLGGESTDAAGVLLGLNRLYNTNLSQSTLLSLAMKVGSDVPYFIVSNFAKVTNYGKDVTSLVNNKFNFFLIIEPNFSLDTKEMYKKLDEENINIKEYDGNILYNDFVKVIPKELKELRAFLMQYKELKHSLTGSGSAYFITNDALYFPNNIVHDIKNNFPKYKVHNHKKIEGHRFIVNSL